MHEMPPPQDQHRRLQALAGTWAGEEKIHPSPWDSKGGSAVARCVARMALGGFWLILDYTQERDGKVSYEGHGVYGWDPKTQRYLMNWFDSMGSIPAAAVAGTWEGSTLSFQHQSEMGHARYVYTFEGDGRYMFRLDVSQDGNAWSPFVEGRFTRK